jgi:hypothetical protein
MRAYVTEMPPPSSLEPAVGLKEMVWDSSFLLFSNYGSCVLRARYKYKGITRAYVTEMPPPSSLEPAVGLKETVWSSAVKAHSTRTVLSVSCVRTTIVFSSVGVRDSLVRIRIRLRIRLLSSMNLRIKKKIS